jgi:hypothetical protein
MIVIETDWTETEPTLVPGSRSMSLSTSPSSSTGRQCPKMLNLSTSASRPRRICIPLMTQQTTWHGAMSLEPSRSTSVFAESSSFRRVIFSSPAMMTCFHPSTPDLSDSNLLTSIPSAAEYAPNSTHFMYTEIDLHAGGGDVNCASLNYISSATSGLPVLHSYLSNGAASVESNFTISSADASPIPTERIPIHYNLNGRYMLPYKAVIDAMINNTHGAGHPIPLHGQAFWIISSSEWPQAE